MIILLSPAKTLDFESSFSTPPVTKPLFFEDSLELVELLHGMRAEDIAELMKLSNSLAQLNYQRYQTFSTSFSVQNSKPAINSFRGDVYQAFDRENFTELDYHFAQKHVRILSGLYGILKPLDGIQPYRLEMGTKLANSQGKNLYSFWQNKITEYLNQALQEDEDPTIINLASKEYSSVINQQKLHFPMINITFKEEKNGVFKVIAIKAKRARGIMANWIIKNKINSPEQLYSFSEDEYTYQAHLSSASEYVFIR
jgi:hypothetical protein